MANFTVEINGLSELRAAFKKAPAKFVKIFDGSIKKAVYILEKKAKELAPRDRGFLYGGEAMKTSFSALSGKLENTAKYAVFVHEGTKPHFPPLKAIKGWADRHGIPAFMVTRSIAKKGTKAVLFFTEAGEQSKEEIDSIFEKALLEFNQSF